MISEKTERILHPERLKVLQEEYLKTAQERDTRQRDQRPDRHHRFEGVLARSASNTADDRLPAVLSLVREWCTKQYEGENWRVETHIPLRQRE